MDISCKKCSVKYRIDDSKIPAQGAKVKCPKCWEIALIKKEAPSISPSPPVTAILSFESQLKNVQRAIFQDEGSENIPPKLKDFCSEMVKSYQLLKKDFSKMEKSRKDMETLVEIGKAVNSVLDMDKLLNLIMDMVINVVGAERGFLMLKDKDTGELSFKVARNMEEELKDKAKFTISSGITSRVAREGKAILSTDAQSDERFSAQASVMDYNLRSLMCVPLKIKDDVIGTVYVDNRMVAGAFTDICGFTSMSEKLPPEIVVQMLNEYFTEMTKIIFENEGTLDKFIGDAIMAVFGTPIFTPYSARNAVKAGIDMLKKLVEIQKKWDSEGKPYFRIRCGINTGEVVAGNIGSPDRMDYTVIGDNVNLASRLESNAKPMTVLISDSTYFKIKDLVTANQREPIMVKGKSKPVQTYEVTDIKVPTDEKVKVKRQYVRKDVSVFATFKIPPNTETNQCIIQNISCGGLLMSTRVNVNVGENILLDFALSDESKFSNIEGKVVMSRPFKDEQSATYFKMGIEFVSINDTDFKNISKFCTPSEQPAETPLSH